MTDVAIVQPGPLARLALGIREQLELVFPSNLFTHQWMPSRVDRAVWERLTQRTPMVGIGFNGFVRVATSSLLNVVSEWSVYVATKNPGGQHALLFGDKLAPGQFALAEAAAAALHGHTFRELGSVTITGAANSFIEDVTDPGLSITAIELTVPIDLSIGQVLSGPGVTPDDLKRQSIAWNFGGATVNDTIITNPGTS